MIDGTESMAFECVDNYLAQRKKNSMPFAYGVVGPVVRKYILPGTTYKKSVEKTGTARNENIMFI